MIPRCFRAWPLLALAWPTSIHAQWTVADTSGTVTINGVASYGLNGYVGISGDLYLSTDAGATWTVQTPELGGFPIYGIMRDAHIPDGQNGVMVGALELNNAYAVLRTTDGGSTWIPIEIPYMGGSSWPRRFNAVHFPVATTGYTVGTNGRVAKTTNGGINWNYQAYPSANEIRSVHFFDANTGIIAGVDHIMRTTNGAVEWTSVLEVTGAHALHVNGSTVVAAGPQVFHVSLDAGLTWTSQPAPFSSVNDVHVFSANHFLVVDDVQDKLFITETGGAYWTYAALPVNGDLRKVHFLSPTNGCVVGGTGGRSMILHTTNGPGPGIPVATMAHSHEIGCGVTTYNLELTGTDPAWTITWYLDGAAVGTGVSTSVDFGSAGDVLFEAYVSNGSHTAVIPLPVTVPIFQPFSVQAGVDPFICHGGTATLSVTMPPGSTVVWEPAAGLSDPSSPQPVASGLGATTTFTATVSNGPCMATDEMTVIQAPEIPTEEWSNIYTGPFWNRFIFRDRFNGFIHGSDTVRRTTDGGNTWTHLHVPHYGNAALSMLDPLHGYVNDVWALHVTNDGWTTYQTIPGSQIIQGSFRKNMFFMDRDTLFVLCIPQSGGSQRLVRSNNGGLSWTVLDQLFANVDILVFPGGDVVLACGGGGLNSGRIYRSEDAGITWQQVALPSDFHRITSMTRNESGTLYANAYADLWRSDDVGLTWTKSIAGNNNGAVPGGSVSFHGPDTGYAVLRGDLWQTVNNGECWQLMDSEFQTHGRLRCMDGGTAFLSLATPGVLGNTSLYRNTPFVPVVQFYALDSMCAGSSVQLINNSLGYDTYEWTIDGVFFSGEADPEPPVLEPGDHLITLVGMNAQGTASYTRNVHILSPPPSPDLTLLNEVCWYGTDATVTLQATSSEPVLTYVWRHVNLSTGSGGLTGYHPSEFTISVPFWPTGYFVVPVSGPGCFGEPSDTLHIHSTNPIPNINLINGPNQVCTQAQLTYTSYFTSPNTSGSYDGSDIIGYLWTLSPEQAGTVLPDSNTCVIAWNGDFTGPATVSCHPIDTCGIAPPRVRAVMVDTGNYVITQPTDVIVDQGQPFSLSVELAAPPPQGGNWYRNGANVGSGTIYSIAEAEPLHAGLYHWRGNSGSTICGIFWSDTVTVTVLGSTELPDLSDQHGMPSLAVYPNPFNDRVTVELPGTDKASVLTVHDATGRTVFEQVYAAGGSARQEVELEACASGVLVFRLVNDAFQLRTTVIKVPR